MLYEKLIENGIISQEDFQRALDKNKDKGNIPYKMLIKEGKIKEEDMLFYLAEDVGIDFYTLDRNTVDRNLVLLFPEETVRRHVFCPLFRVNGTIFAAIADPFDMHVVEEIERISNCRVERILSPESDIVSLLDFCFGHDTALESASEEKDIFSALTSADISYISEEKENDSSTSKTEFDESVSAIQIVDSLIKKAVSSKASDIHIEPLEKTFRVRFRIDGILRDFKTFSKNILPEIVSRIKIMANLNIAEKRLPQDGRVNMNVNGRQIDLRISIVRTIFGEKAVMRILDKSNVIIGLEHLGFSPKVKEDFEREISRSMGIILVTGPTGSGKSTTLYSAISKVADNTKNVMTVEDPIEYNLEAVNQIPVFQKGGITFPTALRTILRQDPDVIMVGEIRDAETAEISIQAALTGHLVLSTLHTNDAVTAVTRLIDMGIEPFLVASSVSCVLAQRLVRKICPSCKEQYLADPIILASLISQCENIDPEKLNKIKRGNLSLYRGRGCRNCGYTGYQGRIGVFELMLIDEDVQRMIVERATSSLIRKNVIEKGMHTMLEDGLEKVFDGVTTLTEVVRVIKET